MRAMRKFKFDRLLPDSADALAVPVSLYRLRVAYDPVLAGGRCLRRAGMRRASYWHPTRIRTASGEHT